MDLLPKNGVVRRATESNVVFEFFYEPSTIKIVKIKADINSSLSV